ncbi:MAG: hypothetical protein AAB601_03300 [Patescibacteria group bacterium]
MRVGSFLRETLLTGIVFFLLIALVLAVGAQLFTVLLFPGHYFTDDPWLQATIGILAILALGTGVRLIRRTRHVWVLRLLPTSLLEHPKVEWLIAPGIYARGVLHTKDEHWSSVMEMNGGPISLTYFPRRIATDKLKQTGRMGKDLMVEMATLGAKK